MALGAQSEGRAAWERYTTARGEREAVQARLAQAVSHSDDVKAELAAANAMFDGLEIQHAMEHGRSKHKRESIIAGSHYDRRAAPWS